MMKGHIVRRWSVIEVWHFGKKIGTIFIAGFSYGGKHTTLPPTNFVPHKLSWLHPLQY
jgi:hypothetical protein